MVSVQNQTGMAKAPLQKSKTHWFCYNTSYYKGMKIGDEQDEQEQQKNREFMAKYMANYGAHRKGMTKEEVAQYYSQWDEYEQDLSPDIYTGPMIAAEEVAGCFEDRREKVRIMDVACGSGRVGEELQKHGFKLMDGIDPSEGLLAKCRQKGIYRHLYQEYCGENPLSMDDSVYDCLVISGGMGEGHIPCSGLYEMMRIVKPGGYIIIVMRKEYLRYVGEYTDKLEPLMEKLEQEHRWDIVDRRVVKNYSFNREGMVYKFRVKKNALLFDNEIPKKDKNTTSLPTKDRIERKGTKTGDVMSKDVTKTGRQ